MSQGLRQSSLDVGEYAEILLGAAAQLSAGAPQLECLIELLPGRRDQAAFEVEAGHGIKCLCGEHSMAQSSSSLKAALTEFSRQSWLVATVVDYSEAAQGFGESATFTFPSGRLDSVPIALYGLSHRSGFLVVSGLL
jgi:hypothetical protein